jgi:hypothetical protein
MICQQAKLMKKETNIDAKVFNKLMTNRKLEKKSEMKAQIYYYVFKLDYKVSLAILKKDLVNQRDL